MNKQQPSHLMVGRQMPMFGHIQYIALRPYLGSVRWYKSYRIYTPPRKLQVVIKSGPAPSFLRCDRCGLGRTWVPTWITLATVFGCRHLNITSSSPTNLALHLDIYRYIPVAVRCGSPTLFPEFEFNQPVARRKKKEANWINPPAGWAFFVGSTPSR